MSRRPRPCWPGIPSVMSRASKIMPAHVASVASPARIASRTDSSMPARSSSIAIVVLSPPGSTMPSSPSRSSFVLTSLVRAPAVSSALTCSAKAPCIARTPISGAAALSVRAELLALDQHFDRRADHLCLVHELGVIHSRKPADTGVDGACVAHCLDDISCARFALGPDHGGAFRDAAGRLAKVAAAADKGHLERMLVDVVLLVRRREDL